MTCNSPVVEVRGAAAVGGGRGAGGLPLRRHGAHTAQYRTDSWLTLQVPVWASRGGPGAQRLANQRARVL